MKEWGWQARETPSPYSWGHCFMGVLQWVKGRVLARAAARSLTIITPSRGIQCPPASPCPSSPRRARSLRAPKRSALRPPGPPPASGSSPASSGTAFFVHPLAQPYLCHPCPSRPAALTDSRRCSSSAVGSCVRRVCSIWSSASVVLL